jgi:hypothetical protein
MRDRILEAIKVIIKGKIAQSLVTMEILLEEPQGVRLVPTLVTELEELSKLQGMLENLALFESS